MADKLYRLVEVDADGPKLEPMAPGEARLMHLHKELEYLSDAHEREFASAGMFRINMYIFGTVAFLLLAVTMSFTITVFATCRAPGVQAWKLPGTYMAGHIVIYGDALYFAMKDTDGQVPGFEGPLYNPWRRISFGPVGVS